MQMASIATQSSQHVCMDVGLGNSVYKHECIEKRSRSGWFFSPPPFFYINLSTRKRTSLAEK